MVPRIEGKGGRVKNLQRPVVGRLLAELQLHHGARHQGNDGSTMLRGRRDDLQHVTLVVCVARPGQPQAVHPDTDPEGGRAQRERPILQHERQVHERQARQHHQAGQPVGKRAGQKTLQAFAPVHDMRVEAAGCVVDERDVVQIANRQRVRFATLPRANGSGDGCDTVPLGEVVARAERQRQQRRAGIGERTHRARDGAVPAGYAHERRLRAHAVAHYLAHTRTRHDAYIRVRFDGRERLAQRVRFALGATSGTGIQDDRQRFHGA